MSGGLFLILSCACSGASLLGDAFGSAGNARCHAERGPELCREARLFWDGGPDNAASLLREAILSRARATWEAGIPIHGEKNVALGAFAPILGDLFPEARFLFLTRDGRECVNVMRGWHAMTAGNLYREGRDQPMLSAGARRNADLLAAAGDMYDFGRPRPLPGERHFDRWQRMTHHEMLCWHWNAWNSRILDAMDALPAGRRMHLDISAPDPAARIADAVRFLGLDHVDPARIDAILERRDSENECFSTWRSWTDAELDQFWLHCAGSMRRCGYFSPSRPEERRWTPESGQWPMPDGPDPHAERREALRGWILPRIASGEISSVLEIGCGTGRDADLFAGAAWTGLDVSPGTGADVLRHETSEQYDLVLVRDFVERSYDMDAVLRRAASWTRKLLILTGDSGFHDDLIEHEYRWDGLLGCHANRLSIPRALVVLDECGLDRPEAHPIDAGRPDAPPGFLIAARRGEPAPACAAPAFALLEMRDSGLSLEDILERSNADCFAAARQFGFGLNPLSRYAGLLRGLLRMGRCDIRPMRDLMRPVAPGRIVVGLRHDVDHDILAALAMSRVEAELGLSGSYYLLHSHPFVAPGYYAVRDPSGEIRRNNALAPIYREIQDNGCEVGLHVDAVRLYENGFDGMRAVIAELAWLRGRGLEITGMAAHNSLAADGVENFEFFREHHLGIRTHAEIGGVPVPLGRLSARELGLEYEANFASPRHRCDPHDLRLFRERACSPDVRTHLFWQLHENPACRWGADMTCWLYGADRWAVAGQGPETPWLPAAGTDDVLHVLKRLPDGARVVLHVHPFHVGLRASERERPA